MTVIRDTGVYYRVESRNATGLRNNNKSGHLQCTSLAVAVRPTRRRAKCPAGARHRCDCSVTGARVPCDRCPFRRPPARACRAVVRLPRPHANGGSEFPRASSFWAAFSASLSGRVAAHDDVRPLRSDPSHRFLGSRPLAALCANDVLAARWKNIINSKKYRSLVPRNDYPRHSVERRNSSQRPR